MPFVFGTTRAGGVFETWAGACDDFASVDLGAQKVAGLLILSRGVSRSIVLSRKMCETFQEESARC